MNNLAFQSSFADAWGAIDSAQNVLLIAHQKPDGDTIGSLTAMMNYFYSINKHFVAYCKDAPREQFSFLPLVEKVTNNQVEVLKAEPYDLVIVFDSGDLAYSGADELMSKLKILPKLLNIDHHHTNTRYGDINIVSEEAASTTEIAVHLFEAKEIAIDRRMATCLLTGLITDTGSFSNPATSVSALNTASELLAHGAKLTTVISHVMANRTIVGLKLWGEVLQRLQVIEPWNIAVTVVTLADQQKYQVDEESTEGIANFLNSLSDIKAILVLKELSEGKVKGSLRTTRDDIDVSRIAIALGGGGHKKAAGFTVDGKIVTTPQGYWQVE